MSNILIAIIVVLTLTIIGLLIYFLIFRKSNNSSASRKLLKNGDVVFYVPQGLPGEPGADVRFSEKIYSENKQFFTAIQNNGIWGIFKSTNSERVKAIRSSVTLITYVGGNLYDPRGQGNITAANIKGDAYLVMNNNGVVQLLDSNGNERWKSS